MALNYSKLEQNEKTYSIYKALLNSSLLTYKQQRWVAKRLGRIEQGKVAINER
ncbi:MAG: ribosome assembly protein YihI (activator of Der GTPase) [Oleispira sp.]|jgi:ribosome assembly protein YihI (activator of Der GTPase)